MPIKPMDDDVLHMIDKEMPEEPGADWSCATCGESFKSEKVFKIHVRKHRWTKKMTLKDELLGLESGDYIPYGDLFDEIDESDIPIETKGIYHDSVGFLEEWRIGEYGSIIIDSMNGDPMIRKTQNLKRELKEEELKWKFPDSNN